MLRLAHEHYLLARVPKIRRLTEAAPRAGFVEAAQFEAIRRRLPVDLQAVVVTIAFTHGWRRDGREVDLTDELRALLGDQVDRVKKLERKLGCVVPYLFPHLRGA